jgi:hypothetical protein
MDSSSSLLSFGLGTPSTLILIPSFLFHLLLLHPGCVLTEIHAVGEWTWAKPDEICGICQIPLDDCAPNAEYPGDDCPVGMYSHPPRERERVEKKGIRFYSLCE